MTTESNTDTSDLNNDSERLTGLKGWLILVGIGIVGNPILLLHAIYTFAKMVFANPYLSNSFHVFFYFKIIEDSGLFILGVFLAILYFKKKKKFVQF